MMVSRPNNWTHDRAHFFKYVSAETALAILSNGALRWSAATCFNDPFDSQFDLHLEYDIGRLTERVLDQNWDVVSGKRDIKPGNKLGQILKYAALTGLGRKMTEAEFKDRSRSATLESITKGEGFLPMLHKFMREQLADFKFLCLAEDYDNLLMWSHYAHHHTGAVLKVVCQPERDSMWGAARKVDYVRSMPKLLTEDQFVSFLGGEISLDTQVTLENIILTKAEDWAYEREWRVALPGTRASDQWQDIGFHPTELGAVYLGCRASEEFRTNIKSLLRDQYSSVQLLQATKSARNFELDFQLVE